MSIKSPPPLRREGDPSCEYVRATYGLTVTRGDCVATPRGPGRVCGATHHVWVQLDGKRHADPWHPSDVRTATEGASP